MRSEIWQLADPLFLPGTNVLDLGCGTGDDALHFAHRGVNVTAVDISPEMISQLRKKAFAPVKAVTADMQAYRPERPVHGIISNFGALNCVPDLHWLTRLPVLPCGHLVLTLMGRFYPLEFAVSLLKGEPRVAFRRFHRRTEAVVEAVRFTVYYHTLRSLRDALGPDYELVAVKGLRSVTPAPHLVHLRRLYAVRVLQPLDRMLCSRRATATWADHFVSVWRRRET